MPIVTLTTDYGTTDYYLAALKASIYALEPDIKLIDISNHIKKFNIPQAAFVVQNIFNHFPKGTIHIVNVSQEISDREYYQFKKSKEDSPNDKYIVSEFNGHYFICPNNGLLPLILENEFEASKSYLLHKSLLLFDFSKVAANTIHHIVSKKPLEEIGDYLPELYTKIAIKPFYNNDILKGTIIYIDSFGNAITNIKNSFFNDCSAGRKHMVKLKPNLKLKDNQLNDSGELTINFGFNDVTPGEVVCFFDENEYLKIAINFGSASQLMGLKLGDPIMIYFL